jgi:hypothetical protein
MNPYNPSFFMNEIFPFNLFSVIFFFFNKLKKCFWIKLSIQVSILTLTKESRYYLSKEFSSKGYFLTQAIMIFFFFQTFSELISLTYSTQIISNRVNIYLIAFFLIFIAPVFSFFFGFFKRFVIYIF